MHHRKWPWLIPSHLYRHFFKSFCHKLRSSRTNFLQKKPSRQNFPFLSRSVNRSKSWSKWGSSCLSVNGLHTTSQRLLSLNTSLNLCKVPTQTMNETLKSKMSTQKREPMTAILKHCVIINSSSKISNVFHPSPENHFVSKNQYQKHYIEQLLRAVRKR